MRKLHTVIHHSIFYDLEWSLVSGLLSVKIIIENSFCFVKHVSYKNKTLRVIPIFMMTRNRVRGKWTKSCINLRKVLSETEENSEDHSKSRTANKSQSLLIN